MDPEYIKNLEFNEFQSSLVDLKYDSLPDEIKEEFAECLDIPYIRWLISKDRPRAKDLPRDSKGRIIIDLTKPHILEDMDYFRPTAIHFQKTGKLTDLKPNANPNSAYGKWIKEEVRRCREGYVRESDGEWVTGNMYYFLNYCPIEQTKTTVGSRKGQRVVDMPEVWDGIYLRFHYIEQAAYGGMYDETGGLNGGEISSRGKSKSLCMASIMTRFFVLGESAKTNEKVKVVAAAYTKEYLNGNDGLLTKFLNFLDFVSTDTQFPHLLLTNSLDKMTWTMGWKDLTTGARKGTLNQASGIAVKDDVGKIRGKRQNFVVMEEFGNFPNVTELYNILLPCVREGNYSFGQMYAIGTSGDKESDFAKAVELIYNPRGYFMYPLPNVYDKPGEGRKFITYFYPEYMNRKGCYDINGNSNVTAALLEILLDRYRIKYNTTDLKSITKNIAERPITPQEALLRTRGNIFPINDLNQRLFELDNDPHIYDDVYIGILVQNSDGKVEFKPTNDQPIRIFPTEDNKISGAVEIYKMPPSGNIPPNRFIIGHDPVDSDEADTMSLSSTFVFDLWTDDIVAEYTGRQAYADDNFEVVRLLALFYNATVMYEGNIKGTFSYFSKMGCSYLLADTPEYLAGKQLLKPGAIGNQAKGIRATKPINNYADDRLKEWLIQPVYITKKDENGEDIEVAVKKLSSLKCRALIQELIKYPIGNFDRIRAMGMVMLYREQFLIKYGGHIEEEEYKPEEDPGLDPFFTRNFNNNFNQRITQSK